MKGKRVVRRYNVSTPFRNVVKSTRYRKPRYTARKVLNIPQLRDATLSEVKAVVNLECESLCREKPSPSYLRSASVQSLNVFEWKEVIRELFERAPVLTSNLEAAAQPLSHLSPVPMIGMAAAVLLKARSKNMCKVQLLIASLLYAGHAAKRVSISSFCECLFQYPAHPSQ